MVKVFLADKREHFNYNVFNKLEALLKSIEYQKIIKKNDIVAIKIHFGEKGNTGFLNPLYAAHIVKKVKELGAKPFLTDGSTIYKGSRVDAVAHIETAIKNGFGYSTIDAPIIIADGLKGTSCVKVEVNGEYCKFIEVGSEFYFADALICMTHFKAHELSGIGGALKNIGMGLAAKSGKLKMHSTVLPFVKSEKCIFCKKCFSVCPVNAFIEKNKKSYIESKVCIGCGQCILNCPTEAIQINWNIEPDQMMKIMLEHAKGILLNKKEKSIFFNFIEKVAPECDCYGHSDTPIVQDVGIACSVDPIAIDKASVDLVNQQEGLKATALKNNFAPGEDKFLALHPKSNWKTQIDYGEQIGVGSSDYEIVRIKK